MLIALEYKELSSIYGGSIATREQNTKNGQNLINEKAYFKIEAQIIDEKDFNFKNRIDGKFVINIENQSILRNFIFLIYNTLVKESNF